MKSSGLIDVFSKKCNTPSWCKIVLTILVAIYGLITLSDYFLFFNILDILSIHFLFNLAVPIAAIVFIWLNHPLFCLLIFGIDVILYIDAIQYMDISIWFDIEYFKYMDIGIWSNIKYLLIYFLAILIIVLSIIAWRITKKPTVSMDRMPLYAKITVTVLFVLTYLFLNFLPAFTIATVTDVTLPAFYEEAFSYHNIDIILALGSIFGTSVIWLNHTKLSCISWIIFVILTLVQLIPALFNSEVGFFFSNGWYSFNGWWILQLAILALLAVMILATIGFEQGKKAEQSDDTNKNA